MGMHPSVKRSFFIKLLLVTAIAGNLYVFFQSLAHTFGFQQLDLTLRWYAFKAPALWNFILMAGTLFTLIGLRKLYLKGLDGYRIYLSGKIAVAIGYLLLIWMEYKIVTLPFPLILIPVLLIIQSIYPVLLYISLRQSKVRIAQ